MSISQLSKLRSKEQYHGKRKTNFKKSKSTKGSVECCICFSMVPKIADNSIMCDKTVNYICGECKFKCNETKNTLCPLCRSHPVKNPVARDIVIPIPQKLPKARTQHPSYFDTNLSPKKKRGWLRSDGPYISPFRQSTNRIRRESRPNS